MARRWIYSNKPIDTLMKDPRLTGLSQVMLKILVNRGIDTVDKIESFMFSNIRDLHDTRLMADADKAVEVIKDALLNKYKIVCYSDYDVDGIGGCTVIVKSLRELGADIEYYTNNRFVDGYGLCKNGIDEIMRLYPDTKLIITVDNGIMAHDGIDYANSLGLKVVVTDHHEQGAILPNAEAIVDPKRKDCKYPFKGLCGAGVAFKLMLLLYYELGQKLQFVYDLMDIVTISTVGDIVPLVDENRIIVKEGLKRINEGKRPIFRLFREVTDVSEVNAHFTLGYVYVPMINAIGRLDGDPKRAIDMFMHEDEETMKSDLEYLKELNERRKQMTEEQVERAEQILEAKTVKEAIVLYDEDFHEGIIGLIAGRIKEKYNRPTIVLSKEKGFLKGSARSIDGLHLKESFDEIAGLLRSYGGHAKAAGLSLEESSLNAFEDAIINLSKGKLTKDDFLKKYYVDCVLKPSEMDIDIVDELKQLEPYGEGFRKPLLALDFKADKPFYMGNEKQHVKLSSDNLSVIIWREAEAYKQRGEPLHVMALGYPGVNVYKNNVTLQFIVDADNFKPA